MMFVAGVDEVGRGPLAGPVVAAAVILNPQHPIKGITDSKALSATRREALAEKIQATAIAWALGRAEVAEIDQLNILQASLLAMQRAVAQLSIQPERILVDGVHCPAVNLPVEAIVKGDKTIPAIGAASIIAKVARDAEMVALDKTYPEYGFARHKGYPTQAHRTALQTYGITPIHRRSFAPVKHLLKSNI